MVTPPTAAARVAVSNLEKQVKPKHWFEEVLGLDEFLNNHLQVVEVNLPFPSGSSRLVDVNVAVYQARHENAVARYVDHLNCTWNAFFETLCVLSRAPGTSNLPGRTSLIVLPFTTTVAGRTWPQKIFSQIRK